MSISSLLYGQQEPSQTHQKQIIDEERIENLYEEGRLLYLRKEYKAAKEKFEEILFIDPDHKGAKVYALNSEKKLKERERRRVKEKEKRIFSEGKRAYNRRNYEEARQRFEEILNLNSSHRGAARYLKLIESKIAEQEEKEKQAQAKAEEEQRKREAEAARQKELEEARKHAEELRAAFKEAKKAYNKRDYREARDRFQDLLELDPNHRGAAKYLRLTESKIAKQKEKERQAQAKAEEEGKREEKEGREQELQKTEEETQKIKLAYQEGKRAYNKRDYETAKLKFDEVLNLDPNHTGAKRYLNLAIYKIKKEKERAEKEEEKKRRQEEVEKTRREKEKVNSIYREGKKAYSKKEYVEAKEKFQEILALDPAHKGAKKYIDLTESRLAKIEGEVPTVEVGNLGKLTIEECIEIAIENHVPLKTAEKQIELARFKVLEARRRLFPAISLKYEDLSGTEYSAGREYEGKTYAIEGQQSVYRGGEYRYVVKQAKVNLYIAEENKKKLRSELILSVEKAFYSLARAKETLEIQQEFLNESEKIYRSVNSQYEKGVCSELDYLDVESRYNQAYFQFISAEEDLKLAVVILKQAMSAGPRQQIDIEYLLEFRRLEIDLESCFDLALKNNPKIKINELVMEYTSIGKKLAVSKGFPKIDIMGSYGEAGEAYKEEPLETEEQWYIGTKINVPFGGSTAEYNFTTEERARILSAFQGTETTVHSYKVNLLDDLRYFSGKKQAYIEHEEAENELEKSKKEVLLEVEESFYNYEKSLIHVDAAKSKLKFQSKEVEILKLKRGLGGASDAQVIDSLMKLSQEEFSYVSAVTDYYSAVATLNKSIGIEGNFKP